MFMTVGMCNQAVDAYIKVFFHFYVFCFSFEKKK